MARDRHPANPPVRLVACGVFRPALDRLGVLAAHPHVRAVFLPPHLHLYPAELEQALAAQLAEARREGERLVCLYGTCFPQMDVFCRRHGIQRVPGAHCFEMLLGSDRFRKLIDEETGTYFLERELVDNFDRHCMEPLELHDEEMRRAYFRHYRRLVYIRQEEEPDPGWRLEQLATFLGLALEIHPADTRQLHDALDRLLGNDPRDEP